MDPKQARVVDELEDLLDREREVLRTGDVQNLRRLADHKARLLERLTEAAGPANLLRLREKAARNARLLDAAGKGIRSVTQRISALRSGPEPFTTYSSNGERATVGLKTGKIEKRA